MYTQIHQDDCVAAQESVATASIALGSLLYGIRMQYISEMMDRYLYFDLSYVGQG